MILEKSVDHHVCLGEGSSSCVDKIIIFYVCIFSMASPPFSIVGCSCVIASGVRVCKLIGFSVLILVGLELCR